jgi:hypothetical protein
MSAKENLVVLCWASNECYTKLCTIKEVSKKKVHDPEDGYWYWPEMIIDVKKKTWKHGEKGGKFGEHFEGVNDIWSKSRYGVIGVYDTTNMKQLERMMRDAQEAVSNRHTCWDD